MPKAVVIELTFNTPILNWQITTSTAHGNIVRSSFLSFAQSGWECDVRFASYESEIYGFYDYVEKLQETPYDLVVCSWRLDEYHLPSFARIVNELSIPTFLATDTRTPYISGGKINSPIVFVGSNENFRSRRIDTWDVATNLIGSSQNFPSYANGVVAGKATKLIDNGFSATQIKEAVQEQAQDYPNWNELFGYGKAPSSYELVTPEPIIPEIETPSEQLPEQITPFIPSVIQNPKTQIYAFR